MIVIAAPNAALDHLLRVDVNVGLVQRADRISLSAGGKGINVGRALIALETPATTAVMLGGDVGRLIGSLAARDRIPLAPVHIAEESRIATICIAPAGSDTVVNEVGPVVRQTEVAAFVRTVHSLLSPADNGILACIGSLPPGFPSAVYADLIAGARSRGIRTFVDASGQLLRETLQAEPDLVKVNCNEAAEAAGTSRESAVHDPMAVLDVLQEMGALEVVITMGAQGSVASNNEHTFRSFRTASVAGFRHAVGAGDVFSAVLLAGLVRGQPLHSTVAKATELASLSTATWVPGALGGSADRAWG